MKNVIMVIMVLSVALSTQAQHETNSEQAQEKNKNASYNIKVNGNCEMCKKRIEKAAYAVKGVKSAEWNTDNHTLHLILNEEKSAINDVKNAIAKVGHDTDEVKAPKEVYEKLHGCCQYDRK